MAKPEFAPGQDMTDVSPEDVAEAKLRAKQTKAANEADKTEPAPAPAPKPEMKVKKMAKGGVTRADGCITKGHTKGRMV
jgi:hypothetical protein